MAGSDVITAYHLRGLADSGGSPGATIDTVAVALLANGSIRFNVSKNYTSDPGSVSVTKTYAYEVTDPTALFLLYDLLDLTSRGP